MKEKTGPRGTVLRRNIEKYQAGESLGKLEGDTQYFRVDVVTELPNVGRRVKCSFQGAFLKS